MHLSVKVLQLCSTMAIAVPGCSPLFFPGSRVRGAAGAAVVARLEKIGLCGEAAYDALRQAAEEGDVHLPLHLTVNLRGGGVLSMGADLTRPSQEKQLRGLVVEVREGMVVVKARRRLERSQVQQKRSQASASQGLAHATVISQDQSSG